MRPRATLIDENKWRAVRFGLDADLVDLEHDTERPARVAVEELVELARPAARRLGCADELALVRRVLDEGTGADEQRAACAEAGSLLAVAQQLAIRTSAWL
jgi:carboxylate-amine ligase